MTQLLCPACEHFETWVIDTRQTKTGTRRRYECPKCKGRFTTFETVVKDRLQAEIERKVFQIGELKAQISELEEEIEVLRLRQQAETKERARPLSLEEKKAAIRGALERVKAKMAMGA